MLSPYRNGARSGQRSAGAGGGGAGGATAEQAGISPQYATTSLLLLAVAAVLDMVTELRSGGMQQAPVGHLLVVFTPEGRMPVSTAQQKVAAAVAVPFVKPMT